MPRLFILVFLTSLSSHKLFSQAFIETQFGGSNFLGASIDLRYELMLIEDYDFRVSIKGGAGALASFGNVQLLHAGMEYHFRKWSTGIEASRFFASPFTENSNNNFVDLLIYPHLTYSYDITKKTYWRFSIGGYFAYLFEDDNAFDSSSLEWQSPVIPGIGLTFGYRLTKAKSPFIDPYRDLENHEW